MLERGGVGVLWRVSWGVMGGWRGWGHADASAYRRAYTMYTSDSLEAENLDVDRLTLY